MKVTVLGCGGSTGVPMVGGPGGYGDWGACDPKEARNIRTRSSILIQMQDGAGVLVDTGPDLRAQLLAHGISRFQAILYTHAHADHIAGIDEVRGINRVIGQPLTAYGAADVLAELEERFTYIFKPWTPPGFFRAALVAHPVPFGQKVAVNGYEFLLFEQAHGRIGSAGIRCGDFAYSTDVVELPESAFRHLAGVDTWMVDCFQRQPHSAHAWLERVLEWRERIQPRRVILTHMGPDMDWAWMQANLPQGVEPGWDGLTLELPDPPTIP
ncbi:MAG: MBL fold metallo-hydrolase [Acetobacter sp.]|uniref:MBL fold metallo-hydrolase n=1 Tax=Acetobacter sp. TaxID=440 RepID=UPI0039E73FB0